MKRYEINFDMDGTIADLYGVENWLEDLINENVRPYVEAKPLVRLASLARVLNNLQRKGYEINIISWLSKSGSDEYNANVTEAKKAWLAKHLPSVHWDNITIVKYGTPKETLGSGILFDDEEHNRNNWNGIAYDVHNIVKILRNL
jgi:5'(3')-deoxyribonucleotidase